MREHGTRDIHHTEHVGVENGTRFLVAGFLKGAEDAVASVVHQHINAAKGIDDAFHGFIDFLLVGHVELDGEQLLRFSQCCAHCFRFACAGGNAAAVFKRSLGERLSESAACAGDQPNGSIHFNSFLRVLACEEQEVGRLLVSCSAG